MKEIRHANHNSTDDHWQMHLRREILKGMAAVADWFVIVNDEVRGPFTADQMRTAAQKGLVEASTSVRKGANGDWFRADQVKGLLPAGPPSLEPGPAPEPADPQPQAIPQPPPVAAPEQPLIQPADDGKPRSYHGSKRRNRRRSNPIPVIVVAVCGIAVLLGMLFWLSRPAPVESTPKTKPAESSQR